MVVRDGQLAKTTGGADVRGARGSGRGRGRGREPVSNFRAPTAGSAPKWIDSLLDATATKAER